MICAILPKDDEATLEIALWWENATGKPRWQYLMPDRERVELGIANARGVFYFGHGSPDAWVLNEGAIRLVDADNIGAAKGAFVVAMACFSGLELASSAIDAGVRAYVGFTRKLYTIKASQQFISAGAGAISVLLRGATAQEFAKELSQAFNTIIEFYRNGAGRTLPNALLYWAAATRSANCIVLKGDPTATLS